MATDNEMAALIKLIERQSYLINVMALYLADQACIINDSLKKCDCCMMHPVTVRHKTMGIEACDDCAARAIVTSKKRIGAVLDGEGITGSDRAELEASAMSDSDWIDNANAERIRRIESYAAIVREREGDAPGQAKERH